MKIRRRPSRKSFSFGDLGRTWKNFLSKMSRRKTVGRDFFETQLKRCLNLWDIVFLGTGHMVGAGIYILTGAVAKETTGPALVVSYFLAGFAAFLASLCYAEFGGRVPKAGSAYSYGYVTIGEFWAFIIGWDMLLENMIGAAALGIAWSGYLDDLTNSWLTRWINQHIGTIFYESATFNGNINFVAAALVLSLSVFMALGAKISTNFNSFFSVINLLVIVFTICYGLTLARPQYWTDPSFCLANMSCYQDFTGPKSHVLHSTVVENCTATDAFIPYGVGGVLSGSAKVFFSYIGFESIASAGEETINPQWTIPWGTLIAMVIVTSAYILMSLTLTMMIPFCTIKSDSAFASAFKDRGVDWARHAVSVGALSGMTTVLFGSLFSTPRGVYAMAEDGLLCKCFGYIHPRTQTPIIGVLIFGVLAALVALVFNLDMLADFVSIGTLMAYSIVACSVIVLRYEENAPQISERVDKHIQQRKMSIVAAGELKPKFAHVKNFTGSLTTGQVIVLMIIGMTCLAVVIHFGQWSPISWWLPVLAASLTVAILLCLTFLAMHEQETTGLDFKVPWVPLLPAFSLLLNIVFMLHLDVITWIRFAVWLLLGSGIYFTYGIWHSKEGKNLKIKKAATDLKLESYTVAEHYINNSEIKEPHSRHPVSKDANDNYVTNVVVDP